MRVGDAVIYTDARGVSCPATVTAVVGSGPSWYKRLDLQYDGGTAADVLHFKDARPGAGCWMQVGDEYAVTSKYVSRGPRPVVPRGIPARGRTAAGPDHHDEELP